MRGRCIAAAWLVALAVPARPGWGTTPFATDWASYDPAPGQFVNNEAFNDPMAAVGPPDGLGTTDGNLTSVVSLGGFGGSIVLVFDHLVQDHPRNPLGLDAIVFGNAVWVGSDPDRHWAECAVIEISMDENGDGIPNDPWCLIPGSHISDPDGQFTVQAWDDDAGTSTPPALMSWVPAGMTGEWHTGGYLLDPDIFGPQVNVNPLSGGDEEGIFGYAEYTPTLRSGDLNADNVVEDASLAPEIFYTVPDDPMTVGVTEGSGGGDAFDVAWAIDPRTGEPADLPGFHFIRLTNGVHAISNVGEKSPEIDAVADAAVDPFGDADADGDIDLRDGAHLQNCFDTETTKSVACDRLDRNGDEVIEWHDVRDWAPLMDGPRGGAP